MSFTISKRNPECLTLEKGSFLASVEAEAGGLGLQASLASETLSLNELMVNR